MRRDLVGDHAIAHIPGIRQSEMLLRRHIAEHRRPGISRHRRTDRTRDVVISRRAVDHHRAEHVERRVITPLLFALHIHRHFVERNVPRSLDHRLHVGGTAAAHKFAEHVEIRNKPRISLEELEEALTQKKGPSETRSYRKRFDRSKFEKENKTEEPSKASTATAMPIYTEEELRALEEQEIDGGQSDYDNYDEELDEQYDYYDDDEGMKRN